MLKLPRKFSAPPIGPATYAMTKIKFRVKLSLKVTQKLDFNQFNSGFDEIPACVLKICALELVNTANSSAANPLQSWNIF